MKTNELITLIFAAIIIPSYLFYLYLRRKENLSEKAELETTNKILLVLKEYALKQPEFASILSKFGLL